MQGAGRADVPVVLQAPGNTADAVPWERLPIFVSSPAKYRRTGCRKPLPPPYALYLVTILEARLSAVLKLAAGKACHRCVGVHALAWILH